MLADVSISHLFSPLIALDVGIEDWKGEALAQIDDAARKSPGRV